MFVLPLFDSLSKLLPEVEHQVLPLAKENLEFLSRDMAARSQTDLRNQSIMDRVSSFRNITVVKKKE